MKTKFSFILSIACVFILNSSKKEFDDNQLGGGNNIVSALRTQASINPDLENSQKDLPLRMMDYTPLCPMANYTIQYVIFYPEIAKRSFNILHNFLTENS